jgi:hypothetical protein
MPKVKKANIKTFKRVTEKAQNIQLTVKAYKEPISSLLLSAAAF